MNDQERKYRRVPIWMLAIIILCMLPAAAYPVLLMHATDAMVIESDKPYLWLYPVYTLACGFLAWQTYGRRTYLSWILLIIMLLTHAAMWLLVAY